jgi:hypothetical protein
MHYSRTEVARDDIDEQENVGEGSDRSEVKKGEGEVRQSRKARLWSAFLDQLESTSHNANPPAQCLRTRSATPV